MTRGFNSGAQANHRKVIAQCKAEPGSWVLVNLYRTLYVAKSTCRIVEGSRNHSKIRWYLEEKGSFEARYQLHEDGWEVYARYVGPPKEEP